MVHVTLCGDSEGVHSFTVVSVSTLVMVSAFQEHQLDLISVFTQ